MFALTKGAYLYKLALGGQLYWALSLCKGSLLETLNKEKQIIDMKNSNRVKIENKITTDNHL